MNFLFFVEQTTIEGSFKGLRPSFSHDLNLIGMSRVALKRGAEVYFRKKGDIFFEQSRLFKLKSVEKNIVQLEQVQKNAVGQFDLIAACFLDALEKAKANYPKAKILFIAPALYFVENPAMWSNRHWESSVLALRNDVDFLCFQNERMRELAYIFYYTLARWDRQDRMLVAPLGPQEITFFSMEERRRARQELGFNQNDIVVLNSGGIYKWTDFYTFLEAFLISVKSGNNKLKLIIPGFKQAENKDHEEYIKSILKLISKFQKAFDDHVYLERDWKKASQLIPTYLAAADVGLNANLDSLENWQSHRVRCVDYISAGIPFITSNGDIYSKHSSELGIFVANAGEVESYVKIMELLANSNSIASARHSLKRYAKTIVQDKVYEALFNQIDAIENEHRERYVSGSAIVTAYSTQTALGILMHIFMGKFLRVLFYISKIIRLLPGGQKMFKILRKTKFADRLIRSYL